MKLSMLEFGLLKSVCMEVISETNWHSFSPLYLFTPSDGWSLGTSDDDELFFRMGVAGD